MVIRSECELHLIEGLSNNGVAGHFAELRPLAVIVVVVVCEWTKAVPLVW